MKKILCDKDGKFLFVHDGDCTLAEFKNGDYLTHKDGTITIYRENECKKDISKVSYHVYLRNNELHFLKSKMSFSYYDYFPSYRFSTEEEKKIINSALAEKGLFYNTKSKCIEKIRWRAKKDCMYHYIDFNCPGPFCVNSHIEKFDCMDDYRFNVHNYFLTKEEAEKKLASIKSVLDD